MNRPKQFCTLIVAVVFTSALPACATYNKCGFAGCPGDAKLTAEVRALFDRYPALGPPNLVYVQTLDRVVYLRGRVDTELERQMAEYVALQAAGVSRVVNSISLGYSGR
jgi:osmotically-inducible protein OsmY